MQTFLTWVIHSLHILFGFTYSKYDTHNLLRIGDEGGESEDMMLASDIEPDKTISAPAAGVSNVSVSWP